MLQQPYDGPVPMVVHVHGAHAGPESDGYPEAWWLPNANNIPRWLRDDRHPGQPVRHATNNRAGRRQLQLPQQPALVDRLVSRPRPRHDPQQRLRGPGGVLDHARRDRPGWRDWSCLRTPCPAPAPPGLRRGPGGHEPAGHARRLAGEVPRDPHRHPGPLVQRRRLPVLSGQPGLLRGPGARRTWQMPFIGDPTPSDIAAIWNPEAFFNTMVVNGVTWPTLEVEPDLYRFRLLNGCNSRFLNLALYEVDGDGGPGQGDPLLSDRGRAEPAAQGGQDRSRRPGGAPG